MEGVWGFKGVKKLSHHSEKTKTESATLYFIVARGRNNCRKNPDPRPVRRFVMIKPVESAVENTFKKMVYNNKLLQGRGGIVRGWVLLWRTLLRTTRATIELYIFLAKMVSE